MNKFIKKWFVLLLTLMLVLPAITYSYASPISKIYTILERGNNNQSKGKSLILKALNKSEKQEIKIIDTDEELKEVKDIKIKDKNSYILGLDISKWNGNIDWKAVKEAKPPVPVSQMKQEQAVIV